MERAAAFDARALGDPGLTAFLRDNHLAVGPAARVWDVDSLTFVAFYYQPDLAEAREHWAAMRAAEVTARQHQNPVLAVTPSYDTGIPGNPTPWTVPITLDFPLVTAGKRGYRVAQARSMAEAAQWNLIGTIWRIRGAVRASLLTLATLDQRQALLTDQENAQNDVVRLMEGQASAGNVSVFELNQARIGRDNARLARMDGASQVSDARTQLAFALGLPRPALEEAHFSFVGLEAATADFAAREIRDQAMLNRADVREALAAYAASQSALQLEVANQYPDLNLGPGYSYNAGNAGDHQWLLGLSLSLPIFNQNQGPIAEANAKRAEAAAHFIAVQARAMGEVDGALANYRVARDELATATVLAANLDRRRESMRALLREGETDRLAMATAEAEYASGALARLDIVLKAQQALGALEGAVQSRTVLSEGAVRSAEQGPAPLP